MPRKKKETEAVEKHFIYELMAMDKDTLKEHYFAVNEAVYYHESKASDASRYKYRIDQVIKIKKWLEIEEGEVNG